MGLIEELDRLFPAYKSQNQNVFNAFEKRFLSIKNKWEKGDCDENKSYSYSYGTTEQARKNAERTAQKAKKNAELMRSQAEKAAKYAQRDVEMAKRDAETVKRDMETAKRDRVKNNRYDTNEDAATKSAIEAELRKDGYLNDGKSLAFMIRQQKVMLNFSDNSSEEFSGSNEKFMRYKTVYERVSGKKLFGDSDQRFYFN